MHVNGERNERAKGAVITTYGELDRLIRLELPNEPSDANRDGEWDGHAGESDDGHLFPVLCHEVRIGLEAGVAKGIPPSQLAFAIPSSHRLLHQSHATPRHATKALQTAPPHSPNKEQKQRQANIGHKFE